MVRNSIAIMHKGSELKECWFRAHEVKRSNCFIVSHNRLDKKEEKNYIRKIIDFKRKMQFSLKGEY